MPKLIAGAVAGSILAWAACDPAFQAEPPIREKTIGVVLTSGDTGTVTIPTAVGAGTPFTVVVETFGGGCTEMDGTEVLTDGMVADVTPYDVVDRGSVVCPAIVRTFEHSAALVFPTTGEATVRVHGRTLPPDTSVVREYIVTVR